MAEDVIADGTIKARIIVQKASKFNDIDYDWILWLLILQVERLLTMEQMTFLAALWMTKQ